MRAIEEKWELMLLILTAGFGLAATSMLFSSVKYIEGISKSAENNVIYEVMTASPELSRLQATISGRFLPNSDITDDDVALRFAIIENRMRVLGTQPSRELRQDKAEATELIDRMQTVVKSVAPQIGKMQSAADAVAALRMIEPLNTHATQLAALTTSTAAKRIADNEDKLIDIFWMLLVEIAGLLVCGVILIAMLRHTRKKARHIAGVDILTGLPNRAAFNAKLAGEFGRCEQPGALAVLMFDLDLFKHVNDTLGHAAGDSLLRAVAKRLRPILSDTALFARLSGDEFAVIFSSDEAAAKAQHAASQIQNAFATPFTVPGTLLAASASIGIAVSSADDREPDDLLKSADLALYAVKEHQRGGVRVYQPALKHAYNARQLLSKDLEQALARDEFELHFQPVVSLLRCRTISFEALLRWRHPSLGWVSPAEFIPIAEETALIQPIGRWVINEACAVATEWPETIGIAVNLSARQFIDRDLTASIVDALTTHKLDPNRLTLEITETALIQNDHSVLTTLNALRRIGVKTSLDDFGTGYASLSYLTRFPFDVIKIDQSFVRGCSSHQNSQTIIQVICDLATKLGLTTVAEGIETAEQLEMVRSAGCQNGQGYLFDRPMPAAECLARLSLEQLNAIRAIPADTTPRARSATTATVATK